MARGVSAVSGLVVVGLLAVLVWGGLGWWRSRRALDAHLESGEAYAARLLERIGTLPDELPESSGVAVSRSQADVLWSHNDSGDAPRLYAVDPSGRLLADIAVTEAVAVDWEDMSSGPCPPGLQPTAAPGRGCLYLGDIGDNNRGRPTLTVYVVVEPRLDRADETRFTVAARSFRYRYPDRPHDSEALAVWPDGDVTVVSKGRTGTIDFFGISAADVAAALTSGDVLTAEYQGNTGIEPDQRIRRQATGAAVSPDGTTLALRTYNEVFFYAPVEGDQRRRRWRDLERPCFLGDREPVGEAIDYLDDKTLLLTSERGFGEPGAIHRLRC